MVRRRRFMAASLSVWGLVVPAAIVPLRNGKEIASQHWF